MHRLQRMRAYREARYRVLAEPPLNLYAGRRRASDEARLRQAAGVRRHWAILTACNPGSRPRPENENARATRRLRRALSGRRPAPLPTLASDAAGDWPEAGFLLADPAPGKLRRLARRLRQSAVLQGRLGVPPAVRWLR
jgi:Protein of unknown function (DUF3293).